MEKRRVPAEVKKDERLEFPKPRAIMEFRRFLGLAGWFKEFIKRYAEIRRCYMRVLNVRMDE
jgi:hypothetical protein